VKKRNKGRVGMLTDFIRGSLEESSDSGTIIGSCNVQFIPALLEPIGRIGWD
jgi:hypothetical protein